MNSNNQYYNKYLKYKKKYTQYGGTISLWGYIQNLISNLTNEDKIVANTILPALGLSFDNIAYKNYPIKEDNSILKVRIDFIKLLQKWKTNNLSIYTTLILDMYKYDLNIVKTEVLKLYDDNIYPTQEQKIKLLPYIKKFYDDILQYCDDDVIENILLIWCKTSYESLDNDEQTFCILISLLSYLINPNINKFNKNNILKIIIDTKKIL